MMTHRSVRDIYEEVAEMQYLKRSVATDVRAKADRSVRDIVEKTLANIEDRGDAAVRELSNKFDGWDRESYALTPGEKQACQIGRAHVLTPVTNAHLVCRLMLEKKNTYQNTK